MWATIQGDCLDVMRAWPDNYVDLIFCSPPYEDARLYLENGDDKGIARKTDDWVSWMVEVVSESTRVCKGLCAFVVEGCTRNYSYSAGPFLLMAALKNAGITLRKPPIYYRYGIPGSGGPDWWRNDYELVICATSGGQLPWSENTATGDMPKYAPGGAMSNRNKKGDRKQKGRLANGDSEQQSYSPPTRVNPGNVIKVSVGGGHMGDDAITSQNEAPFPESLVEPFVRCFCPPNGTVCDLFSGSGTTGKVALEWNRQYIGIDIRESQIELTKKRLEQVTPYTLFT